METRTTCTTGNPAGEIQYFKAILVVTLGVVIALGVPVKATVPIVATGDPSTDFEAIQNALDSGGEVLLRNGVDSDANPISFNLEGIWKVLRITQNVTFKGQDDAAGHRAKIIANNNDNPAIIIDNPGGTVEFRGLNIESTSRRIIIIGDGPWPLALRDACKDFTVKDCNIVGTHEQASCIEAWGGLTGTLFLEGNHITGYFCVGDWALGAGLISEAKWEIYSNEFVASGSSCLAAWSSKGVRIENNRCEGPIILDAPTAQGEIIVKNNIMIQSGHNVYEGNNAAGLLVSHWDGFSGGEISGNAINMNPSEDVQLQFVPAISLADYVAGAGHGAHGLLVQDNTITGKADYGIVLDNGASDNIIRRNNLVNFTALQFGSYGAAQIADQPACHSNLFTGNVIGSLASEAFGGIVCRGTDNDIIRNDYRRSNIPGLTSSDRPCVILGAASEGNLVFELGGLPFGTGGSTEQVLDLPREPDPQKAGSTTTNIVVGHSADILAEDINPGVAQRVREALAILP